MLACSANTFVHAQAVNDSLCMRPDSLHFSNDERLARLQNVKRKVKHAGGILFRFIKSFDDYDTTYISPNYYNFTVMAYFNETCIEHQGWSLFRVAMDIFRLYF